MSSPIIRTIREIKWERVAGPGQARPGRIGPSLSFMMTIVPLVVYDRSVVVVVVMTK